MTVKGSNKQVYIAATLILAASVLAAIIYKEISFHKGKALTAAHEAPGDKNQRQDNEQVKLEDGDLNRGEDKPKEEEKTSTQQQDNSLSSPGNKEDKQSGEDAMDKKDNGSNTQEKVDNPPKSTEPKPEIGDNMGENKKSIEGLKAELTNLTASYKGTWSVYVKNLNSGESLLINNKAMKAASLIKLYIMASVYDEINKGSIEKSPRVDELLKTMITVSSNSAANDLVKLLGGSLEEGMKHLNSYNASNGYAHSSMNRGLAMTSSLENYTSVLDCGLLLERIYKGRLVSAEASGETLNLLKAQTRLSKIPQGVPTDILTANKTGELSDTENDAAIIYGEKCHYIICVMVNDISDTAKARGEIRNVSSYVYDYLNR